MHRVKMNWESKHQGGFTLIELMVGMTVSSLIVYFLLASHTRLARSYRSTWQVNGVQQTLVNAENTITKELRMVGYAMNQGFMTSAYGVPAQLQPSLEILNNRDSLSSDSIRVFYGDGTFAQPILGRHLSTNALWHFAWIDVADDTGYAVNDLVVLSRAVISTTDINGVFPINYNACVLKITAIANGASGTRRIRFQNAGGLPFNNRRGETCVAVMPPPVDITEPLDPTIAKVMPLVSHSYRLDPTRIEQAILQHSPSGELVVDDWQDVGVGIANIQVATHYLEPGDAVDRDALPDETGVPDPEKDWYSSDDQESNYPASVRPANSIPIQMSLSIEAKGTGPTSGVSTQVSAEFNDAASPTGHNRMGDSPSRTLPDVDQYSGNYKYRSSTTLVDLRNMGVGQ